MSEVLEQSLDDYYRGVLSGCLRELESILPRFGEDPTEARRALERHAQNLRGSGATFGYVEISAAAGRVMSAGDEERAAAAEALVARLREALRPSPSPSPRILVVDDDPTIRFLLARKLGERGHTVDGVGTAQEALLQLQQKRYSAMVLDLVLPDRDGRELLAGLRLDPVTASLPVVVLSATPSVAVQTECLAGGAAAFWTKPFRVDEFVASIDRLARAAPASVGTPPAGEWQRMEDLSAWHDSAGPEAANSLALMSVDRVLELAGACGATVADQIVTRAFEILRAALRPQDRISRKARTEVALVLRATVPDEAGRVLQRACAQVRARRFRVGTGPALQVSLTGVVVPASPGESFARCLSRLEPALTRAQAEEGGKVVVQAVSRNSARGAVLLAEDDEVTARVITHRLTRDGFRVIHRTDGLAALEALETEAPVLAILDVLMPGLDGLEVLRRIRSHPKFGSMPCLMLTVRGSEEDISGAFAIGADDYVLKPFSPVEFNARVRRLLERR